jgi:hypothetical protein
MCLACEESDLYYKWELLQQIAKGEMPAGHSEDDLRALGLPLPGEIEVIEEPDGTKVVRQKAPAPKSAPKSAPQSASEFACDSPTT